MNIGIKNLSVNRYGEPLGTETFHERPLRIEPISERNKTQDFRPSWKLFLSHNTKAKETSKISYQSKEYSILRFYKVTELDGSPSHTEIWI